jgi:hypothetical protein
MPMFEESYSSNGCVRSVKSPWWRMRGVNVTLTKANAGLAALRTGKTYPLRSNGGPLDSADREASLIVIRGWMGG